MSDPFLAPAAGGSLESLKGRLLLVYPTANDKTKSRFPTADPSGMVDRVTCRIVVLDGDEPGKRLDSMRIMSGSMVPQILPYVGKGQPVLGRLDKEKFDKGPGWVLKDPTDAEKDTARTWIAENPEPVAKDPFAAATAQ